MRVSLLSDLDYQLDIPGKREIFTSASTGFRCEWNSDVATNRDGTPAFCGKLVTAASNFAQIPAAVLCDNKYFPKTTIFSKLGSEDLHDVNKSTHTTGGSRRSYVSKAFRYALSSDPTKQATGLSALTDWNLDQLNRPFSHYPFVPRVNTGIINYKTQQEWDCDRQTPAGWNAWDVAHMESSHQYALAAMGDPLGMMNFFMLYRWFMQCLPPVTSTFWMNQPRAVFWTLLLQVRAHYLGIGLGDAQLNTDWYHGYKPKTALNAYVNQLVNSWDPNGIPGDIDDRVMTDITSKYSDWNGYGKQTWAAYGWQNAMLLWGCVYALESSALSFTNVINLGIWTKKYADVVKDYAFGGTKGFSYSVGVTQFPDQLTAQKLLDDIHAFDQARGSNQSKDYEVHQLGNGKWIIRSGPRILAAEEDNLWMPPFTAIYGTNDPDVLGLRSVESKPGDKYYVAQYDDMTEALFGN